MMTKPAGDTRPFASFEWMLALRYLRARRKEGFISVIAIFSFLGILLGVATLIIVMAVMNGFRQELFEKILGLDGHVVVIRLDTADFPDYEEIGAKLATAPTVKHVLPLIERQVIVSTPVQAVGAKVRGISEHDLKALPLISKSIKAGSLNGFDSQGGIALGVGFKRPLGIDIGSTVTLISPRGRTPSGTPPRMKSYKVTALFEMGMSEFDRSMVFMPMAEAQRFFDKGAAVDVLDVIVDDPEQVTSSVAEMRKIGVPSLRFVEWRERSASFFAVLQMQRNMMFLILSIIVVVAAFNIVSGLVMLVKDKGREIGILRTMGATQGAIMRVFLITGASTGFVGTLAGCLLAVPFCWWIDEIRRAIAYVTGAVVFNPEIYYLTKMPAQLDWQTTVVIVAMSLMLSVLATLYPSWRASRLDPVEALRYE
ncbi:MAG TPA: lipoprotein-releasing ABC transporter permease subunit [Hyphomicrobiaceae bacterium]|nr:lipoprotein-releasing ABC transporter permease subunit [Hyphomicrobiaceae bacterium]